MLTPEELRVLQILADAYNAFCQLDPSYSHPQSVNKFVTAIHAAQLLVMARLAVRQHPSFFTIGHSVIDPRVRV